MRYYENSLGLFISEVVPSGSTELTKDEFDTRLEEIRRIAAQRAAEAEAAEAAEATEKEAETDGN